MSAYVLPSVVERAALHTMRVEDVCAWSVKGIPKEAASIYPEAIDATIVTATI
ncbi:MAG: hypothetical protein ABI311_09715 [Gemmatimonadaceae bacterium]